MKRSSIIALAITLSLFLVSSLAMAGIYMDEGFEGAVAFQDQNFPVRDATVTEPTPAIIAVKGIRLRAYEDSASYTSATVVTNTGSVTTEAFFEGLKSLKLASGQTVGSDAFGQRGSGNFRTWQFAVSAASAAFSQAAGTVVGSFTIDWDYAGKVAGEGFLQIDLVVESATKMNIVIENNGANVGSFAPGEWRVVSVIIYPRNFAPNDLEDEWDGTDTLSGTTKGPHGQKLAAGAHVFVGTQATSGPGYSRVLPAEIGTGWDVGASGESITLNSWFLTAKNGGAIYVDNLYWDNYFHDPTIDAAPASHEANARLMAFDKQSGPVAPPEASARTWDLY